MKKYIFLAFLVIVVAGGYFLFNNLESIVKKIVNKYGSEITGTDVALQGFKLNLATGEGRIQKFTVGNPKGYDKPYLFSAEEIYVRVNLKSLTTNAIIIEEIKVDKPAMTYEMLSLTRNNISEVLDNVNKNTKKAESAEAKVKEDKPKAKSGESKKVIINKIAITSTNLAANIHTPAIPGVSESKSVGQSIVLPNIEIKDIGKGKDGDSIVSAISKVMNKILGEASKAVVDNKLSDLKGLAKDNLDKAVGDVKDKIKAKGLFDKIKI